MSQPTPALTPRRRNRALIYGTLFIVLAVLSYIPYVFAAGFSGELILTWLSVVLPGLSAIFFIVGLARAFGQPSVYRGKISGSIMTVVSVLFFAASILIFLGARRLPSAAGAPQVGQKAPDFTLSDTSGKNVSLAQLLSSPVDAASGKAPKALLLIFYRGYW